MEAVFMVYAVLVILAAGCAIQALRMARLLPAALWLAGTSAAVSVALYLMGAVEVAVIELSVGAGLVTVLLVFAITMAGDEPVIHMPVVPRRIALLLVGGAAVLLLWLLVPLAVTSPAAADGSTFANIFWHARSADILAQVLLVFTGVLCLLGLMVDTGAAADAAAEPEAVVEQPADAVMEALPQEEPV
jgi:NADH:ubiquinone oxidoreductase subunit 6 (subunit J)